MYSFFGTSVYTSLSTSRTENIHVSLDRLCAVSDTGSSKRIRLESPISTKLGHGRATSARTVSPGVSSWPQRRFVHLRTDGIGQCCAPEWRNFFGGQNSREQGVVMTSLSFICREQPQTASVRVTGVKGMLMTS
jgi:hypothetical protein